MVREDSKRKETQATTHRGETKAIHGHIFFPICLSQHHYALAFFNGLQAVIDCPLVAWLEFCG